jgi:hypothetical protein
MWTPSRIGADRFDLYGALYIFVMQHHSGQWSRGYRILCRLGGADYRPGLSVQRGEFESETQKEIYDYLVEHYKDKV